MMRKRGFTLIELLIVVAIIAILAAIAIPNFLQAQTRAKISRVQSDLRTYATGLESYYVDYNAYPPMADYPEPAVEDGSYTEHFHSRFPTYLTTPVAYISNILYDPFIPSETHELIQFGEGTEMARRYIYFNYSEFIETLGDDPDPDSFFVRMQSLVGPWLTYSWGPNTDYENSPADYVYINYDPTNGTISLGNIFRTQAHSESPPFEEEFESSR